jgi:multiple sugar transport system permease protein/raffinose/stachyose/melibiose transport system permease protein
MRKGGVDAPVREGIAVTGATPPFPTPQDGAPAALRRSRRELRPTSAWFALPALLFVGVFFVIPLVLNLPLAFSSWTTYRSEVVWNGLSNFALLHGQGYLVNAIWVTLAYAVVAMAVQNVVSLSLAYALREPTWLNIFFRSLFFLPVLISPLAAGYVWRGILDPAGPLNGFISAFWPDFDFAWLGNVSTALPAVAFVDAWKWIGLTTLVYIAGINAVPRDVIEAAHIDGANGWQTFWRIIFPMLAPAFTFNIVVTLIGAFSAFDVIQATTGGGPGAATRSINVLLRMQWGLGNFGAGSALGLIITIMVIAAAVPLVAWLRRREIRA